MVFFINGEALPIVHGDVGLVPQVNAIARVAKITVPHRTVIPPNSVVQLESDLSTELTDFIIEPNKEIDLLIPRGYYNASVLPCVSLLNVTNNKIVLQKGTLLGEAIEADVVETGPAPSVATTGIARDNNPLPEQLQNILDKSSTLTKDQQSKVANLLHEFVDVFALDDFDLGTFSHIEHEIDTGDARPIKQRIRRTPMCFAHEEESHLKKMLDAGIIEPSISEWASAPVLVRKRAVVYRLQEIEFRDEKRCLPASSDRRMFGHFGGK